MHRSRNVCAQGEKSPRDPRGFRDGRGQGHEEGNREEYVPQKAVEVICLFPNYVFSVVRRENLHAYSGYKLQG